MRTDSTMAKGQRNKQ